MARYALGKGIPKCEQKSKYIVLEYYDIASHSLSKVHILVIDFSIIFENTTVITTTVIFK